jgi:hypothetical protein
MKGSVKLTKNQKKALAKLPDITELPWEASEKTIAEKYLSEQCGVLHLSWAMDRYWGLVTEKVILPNAIAVYDALVKKKHTEKNPLDFHNDTAFFIPCKNRKVWVHTTQSRDYLYIIGSDFPSLREDDLHVRRIYRDIMEDKYTVDELKNGDIKTMLKYADTLSECHDDHYRYSHRPSLEAYRKVGFQVPYHPTDREKERDFYGDFRDGGYILSYSGWMAKSVHPKVEGSKYVFADLEHLATCYLPCVADALDLDTPRLDGYR